MWVLPAAGLEPARISPVAPQTTTLTTWSNRLKIYNIVEECSPGVLTPAQGAYKTPQIYQTVEELINIDRRFVS